MIAMNVLIFILGFMTALVCGFILYMLVYLLTLTKKPVKPVRKVKRNGRKK